jgi:D-alanyl-D-alanine carboxypeptidase
LARWGVYLFGGKALSEEALNLLLDSKPIDPSNPEVHYGMGVAIYQNGPYGRVYGHGGWIPGYTSSLRYYKDHGVAIAFQINTDIGIVEDTSSVVQTMESRLAEVVLSSKR